MKFCASALTVIAAATGALAQSIGPETNPSEEFGILTIHSTAIDVHLQTWSLNGQQVVLTVGTNLTMTLDSTNGVLYDQFGFVGCISKADGSINFLDPADVTEDYITSPWTSDATQQAALIVPDGLTAYGCDNTTASAYQMFAFSTSPSAMPSCTNVLLQPINGNGIISTLTSQGASSASSASSSASSSAASSSGGSSTASSSSVVTTTSTSATTTSASVTVSIPTTKPAFTGGASVERVMIAGVAAVAGFAGLMIA